MRGVNVTFILGNLGSDPEIRSGDGWKIVSFPVGVNQDYKKKDGTEVKHTEWFDCIVNRKGLNDVAEKYLKKGNRVHIQGKMFTRSWEDDGTTKYRTSLIVDEMSILTPKESNSGQGGSSSTGSGASKPDPDDDLPF